MWERDGGICGICHEAVSFGAMQADHIIQRCLGGTDDLDNLRTTHKACNNGRPRGPKESRIWVPAR